jgi:hypothetical protein
MLIALQTKFFLRFKVANVGACIGQQSFELLKPFFVKPMRDRNTCCIYQVELDESKVGLNNLQGKTNLVMTFFILHIKIL